jgi:hypothetical protein
MERIKRHKIGYRNPPHHTRFKKGLSGNPKGRPKGARSLGGMLSHIIRQKIAVTENGRTRRIPALEVMLRRLANDAMRSEPNALKLLLSLVDRYVDPSEPAADLNTILAEDQAILKHFLKQGGDLGDRVDGTKQKGARSK